MIDEPLLLVHRAAGESDTVGSDLATRADESLRKWNYRLISQGQVN